MSSQETIPPPPLRERQKHRPRPKKEDGSGSRWLARHSTPPPPAVTDDDDAPPPLLTPPPVAVDLAEADVHPDPFGTLSDVDLAPAGLPRKADRRQRLKRIVGGAVGASAVLCLGALLRVLSAHPTSHGPLAAQAPPPAESPAPVDAPSEADAERDHEALELREQARTFLVQRKLDDAISAAQRATLAAPEDATAWLILGAAQMDASRYAEAQATFRACVGRAKSGPVAECRSFIR